MRKIALAALLLTGLAGADIANAQSPPPATQQKRAPDGTLLPLPPSDGPKSMPFPGAGAPADTLQPAPPGATQPPPPNAVKAAPKPPAPKPAAVPQAPRKRTAQPTFKTPELVKSEGPDAPVSAAECDALLAKIAENLRTGYARRENGDAMAAALDAKRKTCANTPSSIAFAAQLTEDMRAISQDLHLTVFFKGDGVPGPWSMPKIKPGETPKDVTIGPNPAKTNYDYQEARVLDGNVGYLKISSFAAPEQISEKTRAAAMAFLANTDAMIIDLRGNSGGGPQHKLMGYFFNDAKLTGQMHWRASLHHADGDVEDVYTSPAGAAAYGEHKPLYILVDSGTFSAAESFAYTLQGLGRATIVGAQTAGGAHPSTMALLNEKFALVLPNGYSTHAVTGTDWEVVGIKPDIAAPSAKALDAAHRAARKALGAKK